MLHAKMQILSNFTYATMLGRIGEIGMAIGKDGVGKADYF